MKRASRFAVPAIAMPAAFALLAACADAGDPASASTQRSERQCFRAEQVNGFSAIDDDTVRVHVGANDVYELELFGPCQDVDWAERIAIRATGGSNWICRDIDAELIVPSAIGPSQCQVSGLRKVPDEELEAERAARQRR